MLYHKSETEISFVCPYGHTSRAASPGCATDDAHAQQYDAQTGQKQIQCHIPVSYTHLDVYKRQVWGYDSQAEDNNVEVYISFLRRKLTHLRSGVRIRTLRMLGYCLTQDEEAAS